MKNLLLSILIAFGTATTQAHDQLNTSTNSVSVSGNGEIQAEPDQATLSISVIAMEENLAAAKQVADDRYKSVLNVIKKAGIPDKQVKVVNLSMQPQYDWQTGEQRYKGERVTRNLNVTINDLDKVADLMQALVDNKVSTVDSMATGFQNRRELVKQALGLATSDAKDKAAFLAEQLDRNLGEALEISEHNDAPIFQPQRIEMRSKSLQGKAAPVPPSEMFGTKKIAASVTIRFELD